MHLARPTMIRPVLYSGRSGRNSHASANMNAGAATQLMTTEVIMSFLSASTFPVSSYRTFASTGNIITSRPMAIGSDTSATLTESSASARPGTSLPNSRPSAMAAMIHTGRKRSSVDIFAATGESVLAGAVECMVSLEVLVDSVPHLRTGTLKFIDTMGSQGIDKCQCMGIMEE